MKMTGKVFGINFDEKNLNGRVYDKDAVKNALSSPSYNVVNENYENGLSSFEIYGSAKPEVKDDGVYVDIEIFNTPVGNHIQSILASDPESLLVTPVGRGMISKDGIVRDYTLSYFTLSASPKCV